MRGGKAATLLALTLLWWAFGSNPDRAAPVQAERMGPPAPAAEMTARR